MGIVEQLWFLGLDVSHMNDLQKDQVFTKVTRFLLTAKHKSTVDMLTENILFTVPPNAYAHSNDNFYCPSSNEIALRGKGAFTGMFSIFSQYMVGAYCDAFSKFKEMCFFYFNLNGDVIMTQTHSKIAQHEQALITSIQNADWDKMAAYFMVCSESIYSYQFVWAVALLLHIKKTSFYTPGRIFDIWHTFCQFYVQNDRILAAIDCYRRVGIMMAIMTLEFNHVNDVYSYVELDGVYCHCLKLEESMNVIQLNNFGNKYLNMQYFEMRHEFRNLPLIQLNTSLHKLVDKVARWHKQTLSETCIMYKSHWSFICVIVEGNISVTINKNRSMDVEVWSYQTLQHTTNKQETQSFPHDIWLRKLRATLLELTREYKI